MIAKALVMAREERQIGAHRFVFETPDALYCTLEGPLSVEETQQFVQLIKELGAKHGPLVTCTDVSRFKSSGARVRQVVISEMNAQYPVRAAIIVGAPFAIRVAMMMVVMAAKHISPGLFTFPIEFVATEDEARAVIDLYLNPVESGERCSATLLQTGT